MKLHEWVEEARGDIGCYREPLSEKLINVLVFTNGVESKYLTELFYDTEQHEVLCVQIVDFEDKVAYSLRLKKVQHLINDIAWCDGDDRLVFYEMVNDPKEFKELFTDIVEAYTYKK